MPFMAEMLQYCGRRFRVHRRADKTCDTISFSGSRRLEGAVHLGDLRCNGAAHGGCQAGCLLFWKEAWLKRVPEGAPEGTPAVAAPAERERLDRAARTVDADGERFTCQATELLRATRALPWWDVRQYVREIATGNVTFRSVLSCSTHALSGNLRSLAMRFVAFGLHLAGRVRRGLGLPRPSFFAPPARPATTPAEPLDLAPGDLVTVRSRGEIRATLDHNSRNRGLYYDPSEMRRFCGGTYRVLRRVERIIDEKTGRMMSLRGGCVVLDGVVCSGERSENRRFCPRAIFPYWRQIWLKRVS
jgi:hypothetical protein